MMADPAKLIQAQMALWNDYLTLWQRTPQRHDRASRPSR